MMNVSVVIPTYNRPDYLERLLDSILAQTYESYEVIVVHDGPVMKKAYEILIKKYSDKLRSFSFSCNDKSRGAPYTRNQGIKIAQYELLALVDDDDEWLPNKLMDQVSIFNKSRKNLGLVYTWTDVVEGNKRIPFYRDSYSGNCLGNLLNRCFIPSPSVMVRKKAIIAAGLFDEALPSCQDWDMWTRICQIGYEVDVVKKPLTLYHKQTSGSIGTSNKAKHGYKMYYRKHFWKIIRHGEFRHIARFFRLTIGI